MLFQRCDLLPVGLAGVPLGGRAGVQRDGGRALLGGDPARVEVGVMSIIDSDPEFDRHGDVGALVARHRRRDDLAEQSAFERQRRTAAATGDLGDRAAEVHVDVIGQALVGDHLRRGDTCSRGSTEYS